MSTQNLQRTPRFKHPKHEKINQQINLTDSIEKYTNDQEMKSNVQYILPSGIFKSAIH